MKLVPYNINKFLGKKFFFLIILLEIIQIFFLIISYYFLAFFLINLIKENDFQSYLIFAIVSTIISFSSKIFLEHLIKKFKIIFKKNYYVFLLKKNKLNQLQSIEKFTNNSFYFRNFYVTSLFFIISLISFIYVDVLLTIAIIVILLILKKLFLKKNNLRKIFKVQKKILQNFSKKIKSKDYKNYYKLNLKRDSTNVKVTREVIIFEIAALIIFFTVSCYLIFFHSQISLKDIAIIIISLRFLITGIMRLKNNIIFMYSSL